MSDFRIPRRAYQLVGQNRTQRDSRCLSHWRDQAAYVLLGDPGAGKSEAFKMECEAVQGLPLRARDVVAGIVPTVFGHGTVFIDGLDEVRAGSSDGRLPFDAIRKWLHDSGRPRFRLSCREADWLGSSDREDMASVSPTHQVAELHLEPLDDEDIDAILASQPDLVPDRQAFLNQVARSGLSGLLRNPLLLDLIIQATREGREARTRAGIYQAACHQLIQENNRHHLPPRGLGAGDTELAMEAAGLYCAIVLLSGLRGVALHGDAHAQDTVALSDLPAKLRGPFHDQALHSKVFTVTAGVAEPRHRSIAEYLGAWTLSRRIAQGLPLQRVMALMQGQDGVPVEAMRGLWAWLAIHHVAGRQTLIQRDPLGFVFNADPAQLSTAEKTGLLHALQTAAAHNPWFLHTHWEKPPFSALATTDMADAYAEKLADHTPERGHQSFADLAFDALSHGQPMPSLAPVLAAWVEDKAQPSHLRVAAYRAWRQCSGLDTATGLRWLLAISEGTLTDPDDELCGTLLGDLYPQVVSPAQVFMYWHPAKSSHVIGAYRMFWAHQLVRRTPEGAMVSLVDGWAAAAAGLSDDAQLHHASQELATDLLAAALEQAGDRIDDSHLYTWLGLGLDEYGTSRLERSDGRVSGWLTARPERIKAVVQQGYARTQPDAQGRWPFWEAEQHLHGAKPPADWFRWLLARASEAPNAELARHCFVTAAHAAVNPVDGLDSPTLDDIEAWLERHQTQWPEAQQWLEGIWWLPTDHWLGNQSRRAKQRQAELAAQTALRKAQIAPHLPDLLAGTGPLGLQQQVAIAYTHGFSDVQGNTPLERVRNLLVCDEVTALAAVAALPKVLERDDLPTAAEAIASEAKGGPGAIRDVALLGAKLAVERHADAPLAWPQSLCERLVAYYLTDGTGEMPTWYRKLAGERPEWVATVLLQYARPKLRHKGNGFIAGLWPLERESDHQRLARLVLPELLNTFPARASEPARRVLNQSLLPALRVLPAEQAAHIIQNGLARAGLDTAQRISWLVADLPYRSSAANELATLIGHNEVRANVLGAALAEQEVLQHVTLRLQPQALQRLIELLAPTVAPADSHRNGFVTDRHRRSDTVRGLLHALASDASGEAQQALAALRQHPALRTWEDFVRYQQHQQVIAVRTASYRIPNPVDVARALADLEPASPPDLRALVVDHLRQLENEYRHGNANSLGLFWSADRKHPKDENDCRDVLLLELRRRLEPLNITVSPEHHAARAKRMDLCVEYMRDGIRMALPIEIKRTSHEDLWIAWRSQLQALYANDPAAAGYGLYLLLWFGAALKVRAHPQGVRPANAEQLRQSLEECIPMADRFRILVHVMDLSWPA